MKMKHNMIKMQLQKQEIFLGSFQSLQAIYVVVNDYLVSVTAVAHFASQL